MYRALELSRDKIGSKGVSEPKYQLSLVSTACNEFNTNPITMTIANSCTLDKALLTVFYRYLQIEGMSYGITGYELFIRLGDLIGEMNTKQNALMSGSSNFTETINKTAPSRVPRKKIHLLFPPWNVYKEAIERLLSSGLLKKSHISTHYLIASNESLNKLIQNTVYILNIDPTDIKIAFKMDHFLIYLAPGL